MFVGMSLRASLKAATFLLWARAVSGKQTCRNSDERDYTGEMATTRGGLTCQNWTAFSPHNHTRTAENYPKADLRSNYCRNPDKSGLAWCYTTDPDVRWDYCNTNCKPNKCSNSDESDYHYNVNVSISGAPCLDWSKFSKEEIGYLDITRYPNDMIDMSILKKNYCRNPNGAAAAWCYTDDWSAQYCAVSCDKEAPAALQYRMHQAVYTVGLPIRTNYPIYITGKQPFQFRVEPFAVEQLDSIANTGFSGSLPPGLVFNAHNGLIVGTPIAPMPAKDYRIVAQNSKGISSSIITIAVVSKEVQGQISTYGGTAYDGSQCDFPFEYKGKSFDQCITQDSGSLYRSWCFVKEGSAMNDYSDSDFGNNLIDSDRLWGFCEYPGLPTTGPSWMHGGSATEGQLCVFPFTYEDVEYNDCIDKDGSGNPWCYTGGGKKNWGSCVYTYPPSAPSELSYKTTLFELHVGTQMRAAYPAVKGSQPMTWTVSPSLPAGLTLDDYYGQLMGTPESEASSGKYIVSVSNAMGSASFTITVAVLPALERKVSFDLEYPETFLSLKIGEQAYTFPTTSTDGLFFTCQPFLPRSLVLNERTGIISGPARQYMDLTQFTITATNLETQKASEFMIWIEVYEKGAEESGLDESAGGGGGGDSSFNLLLVLFIGVCAVLAFVLYKKYQDRHRSYFAMLPDTPMDLEMEASPFRIDNDSEY